ncbi:hypothetical protein V1525DRAFT_371075 [Lipomyces kononenkoae]|uniref:Uncharacterized protein n=1 Tax=Lipomyces kononenkoae TaxID=34357 RepID=A0ACC3T942_LIPKO
MPSFLRRSSTSGSRASNPGTASSDNNNNKENRRSRLSSGSTKITPEERSRMKQRTANIADPILTAMREEQPFEVSAAHLGEHSSVSPEMHMRDMFGNVIQEPDRSNPTRSRSERPLDTIRSFEYAVTGDRHLKEQIFRERLPWEGRRYQQAYNPSAYGDDSYDNVGQAQQHHDYTPPPPATPAAAPPRQTIQLGNSAESAYVDAESLVPNKPQKEKKRGLFGRKK